MDVGLECPCSQVKSQFAAFDSLGGDIVAARGCAVNLLLLDLELLLHLLVELVSHLDVVLEMPL